MEPDARDRAASFLSFSEPEKRAPWVWIIKRKYTFLRFIHQV